MPEKPDSDRDVLTSLPHTRPTRRSAKREDPKAAARPKAAAKAKAAAKPATAARAGSRAKAPPKSANGARADRPASTPRRKVPPAGYAAPTSGAADKGAPGPTEVVTTAVQAAGELTQIAVTVGRQALKSALGRLPRP